jgi:hypothetical protein
MSQMYVIKGHITSYQVVVAKNGLAVDLTAATLTFEARKDSPTGDVVVITKTIGNGIVVTDAINGRATLTIAAEDTAALSVEQALLYYNLILNAGPGQEIVDSGTLSVQVDTTPILYISVADVRALGLTDTTMFPDALVLANIKLWQSFIERACRQWFYPLELEMTLDGTDSDAIHFGVPVISVSEVRLNGDTTALDPRYYRVYHSLTSPADRNNPRIKLIEQRCSNYDIFTAPLRDGRLKFRFGRQNQYIKGVFGYIEPDGSCPYLIQRALAKLVVEKLTQPIYVAPGADAPAPPPVMAGIILEEWTDGHKIKYAQSGGELKPRAPGLAGITNDPEVLGILRLYKAPIGVATPNNPSGR